MEEKKLSKMLFLLQKEMSAQEKSHKLAPQTDNTFRSLTKAKYNSNEQLLHGIAFKLHRVKQRYYEWY